LHLQGLHGNVKIETLIEIDQVMVTRPVMGLLAMAQAKDNKKGAIYSAFFHTAY
jgi:hypothetical protein